MSECQADALAAYILLVYLLPVAAPAVCCLAHTLVILLVSIKSTYFAIEPPARLPGSSVNQTSEFRTSHSNIYLYSIVCYNFGDLASDTCVKGSGQKSTV